MHQSAASFFTSIFWVYLTSPLYRVDIFISVKSCGVLLWPRHFYFFFFRFVVFSRCSSNFFGAVNICLWSATQKALSVIIKFTCSLTHYPNQPSLDLKKTACLKAPTNMLLLWLAHICKEEKQGGHDDKVSTSGGHPVRGVATSLAEPTVKSAFLQSTLTSSSLRTGLGRQRKLREEAQRGRLFFAHLCFLPLLSPRCERPVLAAARAGRPICGLMSATDSPPENNNNKIPLTLTVGAKTTRRSNPDPLWNSRHCWMH